MVFNETELLCRKFAIGTVLPVYLSLTSGCENDTCKQDFMSIASPFPISIL